jgi:hypothetical protein
MLFSRFRERRQGRSARKRRFLLKLLREEDGNMLLRGVHLRTLAALGLPPSSVVRLLARRATFEVTTGGLLVVSKGRPAA